MHEALACRGPGKHVSLKGRALTRREAHLEIRRKEAEPFYINPELYQSCRVFALRGQEVSSLCIMTVVVVFMWEKQDVCTLC